MCVLVRLLRHSDISAGYSGVVRVDLSSAHPIRKPSMTPWDPSRHCFRSTLASLGGSSVG